MTFVEPRRITFRIRFASTQVMLTQAFAHLDTAQLAFLGEIHWGKGHGANRFLTVIYQIDAECRRLLWVGPKRTEAT